MGEPGFLVYKCRRCGEVEKSCHVPNVQMAVILITEGQKLPSVWGGI